MQVGREDTSREGSRGAGRGWRHGSGDEGMDEIGEWRNGGMEGMEAGSKAGRRVIHGGNEGEGRGGKSGTGGYEWRE